MDYRVIGAGPTPLHLAYFLAPRSHGAPEAVTECSLEEN